MHTPKCILQFFYNTHNTWTCMMYIPVPNSRKKENKATVFSF